MFVGVVQIDVISDVLCFCLFTCAYFLKKFGSLTINAFRHIRRNLVVLIRRAASSCFLPGGFNTKV